MIVYCFHLCYSISEADKAYDSRFLVIEEGFISG
jgi:hypothetical protein